MKLTQDDINNVAIRANFFFNVWWQYHTFEESVVYTGDGVSDLDRLINMMAAGTQPTAMFQVDVGSQYSIYKQFDLQDLIAIRTAFIGYYGTVDRPNVYTKLPPVYEELPRQAVIVANGSYTIE